MGAIKINRATNANCYLNGQSLLGKVEEINLPDVAIKTVDHKALGMIGTVEFFSGIDKMEGSIKWNSIYPEVMVQVTNPMQVYDLQVRSSVDTYDSSGRTAQVPLVILLKVMWKNVPAGNWKQHENVDISSKFNIYYLKINQNGQDIVEIDVLANIYKVNGVDQLTQYRNNIGE